MLFRFICITAGAAGSCLCTTIVCWGGVFFFRIPIKTQQPIIKRHIITNRTMQTIAIISNVEFPVAKPAMIRQTSINKVQPPPPQDFLFSYTVLTTVYDIAVSC